MSSPAEDGHPRSGAGIDPDRPAIHRERPPAVPGLAAGLIRRRPSGARPPLPKNLRGAARFWLVMISLLVVAPFLGLGAAAGSGSYVGEINDAARKVFEHAHSAGLTALIGALSLLGSVWTLGIVRLVTCAVLVIFRRWQHLLAFAGSVLVVGWVVHATTPAGTPGTPLPTGVGAVAGALGPSAAVAGLAVTAVGIAYALVPPGRARRLALAGGGVLLAALSVARLSGGGDLSGVVTGAIVGVAIPLVLFRLLAPERSFPVSYRRGKSAHLPVDGPRGQAIRRALADQLGIQVAGEPEAAVFGKLYALTHLRSDRWYKLGRMMLYGALEDEKPFNSVRRLVEYEDYMLRLMADVGVPSAAPCGFVELTPEREYLLVAEFLAGERDPGRGGQPGHDPGRPVHHPQPVDRRHRPPRRQALQPAGPRREGLLDRRGVLPGAALPLAPGGGPREHDAGPRAAHVPGDGLPGGTATVQPRGHRRSVRRHPRDHGALSAAGRDPQRRPRSGRRLPGAGASQGTHPHSAMDHPAPRRDGGCAPRRGARRVTAVGQPQHRRTEVSRPAAPSP